VGTGEGRGLSKGLGGQSWPPPPGAVCSCSRHQRKYAINGRVPLIYQPQSGLPVQPRGQPGPPARDLCAHAPFPSLEKDTSHCSPSHTAAALVRVPRSPVSTRAASEVGPHAAATPDFPSPGAWP